MRATALIPSRTAILALAAACLLAGLALLLQVPSAAVQACAGALVAAGAAGAAIDVRRTSRALAAAPLQVERRWPQALALGVRHTLELTLLNAGRRPWHVRFFDGVDATLDFEGLPQCVRLPPAGRVVLRYSVVPRQRGAARFAPAQLRVRSLWGLVEVQCALGAVHELRVFPNFAAVARYAWLAGDHRLRQIGIKNYAQRGPGTDFKQLREYAADDPVRHVDWKATLRHGTPIVREFEDSRDQCVIFLLDCGRRMRADEGAPSIRGGHFDQCLNAMLLLAYVALKEGDQVGVMTFGAESSDARSFAPRKGAASLNALMARFYDVEPGTTYSDYQQAARRVMTEHRKRALVVLLTNFRDEDVAELEPALKLLRTRHLVLLASLRELAHRELARQPMKTHEQAAVVAAAHLFEQSRRDAFARLVGSDPLAIDVEPSQLAAGLVNRYHAVKRARLL